MKAKRSHLWDRQPEEWYVEPERATIALLRKEQFRGFILDPACGGGNIVKTCRAFGYKAYGSDIIQRWDDPQFVEADFLTIPYCRAQNIITNPPYFKAKGTEAFIRKALQVADYKVAMFADIRFLAGAERAASLFAEHPPTRIWIVTPRVSCPPGTYIEAGGIAGNGSSDFVWMVWDLNVVFDRPKVGWLRREDGDAGIFG